MSRLSEQVKRTDYVVVGDPPVPVRVHRPVGADGQLPALIDIHGGGLIVGSHQAADVTFDRWCPMFGVVGISVGYRLAPETPYPGAIEDCYAALIWTYRHARELGIDPVRIGIGWHECWRWHRRRARPARPLTAAKSQSRSSS